LDGAEPTAKNVQFPANAFRSIKDEKSDLASAS
jgi:hypothetical protein